VILTSLLVSQTLKISESEYDIRKIFGVGVEFVGVGVESESEIRDSAHLWHIYRLAKQGIVVKLSCSRLTVLHLVPECGRRISLPNTYNLSL